MLKSRDITLPTKVRLVKARVCPIVIYGREIWTINKAEHRTIDVFELFFHQSHPQLGIVFALAASLHSFWSYFSTDLQ